jgi:cytochrome c-type biogenesis protein CcmH
MIAALVFLIAAAADLPLDDARLEGRAQALMREIRCVVCENEPVSHSTADIAVDMRRVIREKISEGASDAEVRAFFSQRYGQFVLFRPPLSGGGLLIWLFPFALLAAAGGWIVMRARGAQSRDLIPVDDGEAAPDGRS